jgi:hypothetical protein
MALQAQNRFLRSHQILLSNAMKIDMDLCANSSRRGSFSDIAEFKCIFRGIQGGRG